MKNKHITQINVYHTPDRSSRPDLKAQSHLKTTIPSVFENSQSKQYSQFGVHRSKMNSYEFNESPQIYSQKRASKNQWELKQKVDQYQSKISILREYLRGCPENTLQKGSVSRIFGFQNRDGLDKQQQRVIKQLGSKVKSLIKQNNSLKSKGVHFNQLNIEQIIHQNQKLQLLLEDYKIKDSTTHERLMTQGQLLKDQIYRLRVQYEEKIKLMEIQHEARTNHFNMKENQYKRKINQLEKQNADSLRNLKYQHQKNQGASYKEIQQINQKRIKQIQNLWKKKFQDQQNYYLKITKELQSNNKQFQIKLQNDELKRLKQHYVEVIQDMQAQQKMKLQKLQKEIIDLNKRIEQTNQSISHLKFQRANRLQSTIRKSRNIALSSIKPKGQSEQQPVLYQQAQQYENVRIDSRPLSYSLNPVHKINSSESQILNHKINFQQKEINQLRTKLRLNQKLIADKTEKIIILENQVRNLNQDFHQLNLSKKNSTVAKQVIKEVPVSVVPKDYTQEVKSIKQSIISCNLSNFDVFQTQFNEIIEQRNQMNQKLMSLKKQAKQSSKVLILEKHLKVQRQRNKQLEGNIRKYEQQIQKLKIQIIQLQNEIQNLQIQEIKHDAQDFNGAKEQTLSDGKAGLEWQKVVKHCLLTSVSRLQNLQNKMKEDIVHE